MYGLFFSLALMVMVIHFYERGRLLEERLDAILEQMMHLQKMVMHQQHQQHNLRRRHQHQKRERFQQRRFQHIQQQQVQRKSREFMLNPYVTYDAFFNAGPMAEAPPPESQKLRDLLYDVEHRVGNDGMTYTQPPSSPQLPQVHSPRSVQHVDSDSDDDDSGYMRQVKLD